MAWIAVDLDDTLIQQQPVDPMMGDEAENEEPLEMPVDGAVEAMTQLAAEGHRLTVFTSRFAPMPESERQRLKEQIEQDLASMGFPPMEVWTGTTKPSADLFIDDKAVTFDGDWPLALAQAQYMMEERGLVAGPEQLAMQQQQGEEVPPEEGAL